MSLQMCFVLADEVFIAYVTSTKAHAKILSVDTTEAMKSPGVVDYINYKDVPGHNNFGMWTSDSQIFAVDKVKHPLLGQTVYSCLNEFDKSLDFSIQIINLWEFGIKINEYRKSWLQLVIELIMSKPLNRLYQDFFNWII